MRVVQIGPRKLAPRCAVCECRLQKLSSQDRTPYLCLKCEEEWGQQRKEPWLHYLINEENKRRNPNLREEDVGELL